MKSIYTLLIYLACLSYSNAQSGGISYWNQSSSPDIPPTQTVSNYMNTGEIVVYNVFVIGSVDPFDLYICDNSRKAIIHYSLDNIRSKNGTVVMGRLDASGESGYFLKHPRKIKRKGDIIYVVDGGRDDLNRVLSFNRFNPYGTVKTLWSGYRYIIDITPSFTSDEVYMVFEQYRREIDEDQARDMNNNYVACDVSLYTTNSRYITPIDSYIKLYSDSLNGLYENVNSLTMTPYRTLVNTSNGFYSGSFVLYKQDYPRQINMAVTISNFTDQYNPRYSGGEYPYNRLPENHNKIIYTDLFGSAPYSIFPIAINGEQKNIIFFKPYNYVYTAFYSYIGDIENYRFIGDGIISSGKQLRFYSIASNYDQFTNTPGDVLFPFVTTVFMFDETGWLLKLDLRNNSFEKVVKTLGV